MRRAFLAATVAGSLVLAACGSDEPSSADTIASVPATEPAVETTVETTILQTTTPETTTPETTSPETTSPETTTTVPDADDPSTAASAAWSLVFDSTVLFDDKAPHLAEAETLRPTVEAYSAAGGGFGGITLEPTAVEVAGEVATITYDVNFGANPAYGDQTGTVALVDGVWTVSRDEFCSFMASARVSCP